jgi:hypothetical protein
MTEKTPDVKASLTFKEKGRPGSTRKATRDHTTELDRLLEQTFNRRKRT